MPQAKKLRVVSGEVCPASGYWSVHRMPGHTACFMKGGRMPTYDGKHVTWILTEPR